MIDTMRDIRNALEAQILATLGSGYQKLQYVEDVEKNSFRTNSERYGVRALSAAEGEGVTKSVRITQQFEVVLTKSYYEAKISDSEQIEKSLDNRENLLDIYKQVVNTRLALPTVLNVTNLVVDEPEFLEEEKVVVQRATMDITYRFSLI